MLSRLSSIPTLLSQTAEVNKNSSDFKTLCGTMKWVLVSCISIIFLHTFIYADTREPYVDFCFDQTIEQVYIKENCAAKILNETEFEIESRTTLLNYSGDNAAILALIDKYCPLMPEVLECTRVFENVHETCLIFASPVSFLRHYTLLKVMLNYTCENGGENLLQFLQLNGVSTVYKSRKLDDCVYYPLIDVYEKIIGECDELDKLFDCYTLSVETHTNKTQLVALSNEVRVNMRQAFNCTSPTYQLNIEML